MISGLSTRVGAAQNLAERHIDLAAITQADGWRSTRIPCNVRRRCGKIRDGEGGGGQRPQVSNEVYASGIPAWTLNSA